MLNNKLIRALKIEDQCYHDMFGEHNLHNSLTFIFCILITIPKTHAKTLGSRFSGLMLIKGIFGPCASCRSAVKIISNVNITLN